jgi:tetratricopeptide (TPR) repeat protein
VFLRGVAQLTAAVAAPETDRPSAKSRAVATMAAGLAEWDRRIREQRARVVAEAKDASPDRAFEAQKSLGLAYLERGRFGDALDAFDVAAAPGSPCRGDAHVLRAIAHEALIQPVTAAQAYLDAWRCAPADPARAYDVLRYRVGTAEELAAARSALLDASRRLAAGQPLARYPVLTPGAIPDNLASSPVLADGSTQEGYALLARHEYDAALAALSRAAAGSSSAARDSALERFTRARGHEARNEIADARREYEAAAEGTLVGRAVLHRGIGLLARVEGDFARAVRAFERAVGLNPNDAHLRVLLAQVYVGQERLDDAFREVVAALLVDPEHAPAYVLAGQIHLDTGRPEDAVGALRKALALQPANHEPRYALAAALMRVGRVDEAAREREAFERASREALERRRREMAAGVQRERALRDRLADEDGSR